jgi:signal transduction histidine kinase/CheY-like chemotaxis protein/ligand-binding sensor domain-containing protein
MSYFPISRFFNKNAVLLACLFMISSTFEMLSQEQVGRPFVNNYTYQEYGAGPVSWWALEDKDGIMYFANGDGVLQYDGVNWNLIEVEDGTRCLTKDEEGTIYAGGNGEIGYLKPDTTGKLEFISLMDKVPEEHKVFSDVWEVDFFEGRVIFRTEFKLYCWDGKTMKVIISEDAYHVGSIVNGVYYLRIWGRGLCVLTKDDTFELVPGGERFADKRIYSILPYDDSNILIGTRNEGFYLYDNKNFKPFKTEADEYLKGNLYLPGVALKDGRFVFNTFSDGVYMIDHQGKLIQKYTTENGLQDGSVDFVYIDSRGVLWMVLFNGLANVNLNSTFTILDSNMGLPTNVVFAVFKFKNILYLSTNNGISYLEDGSDEIIPIDGTFGQGGNFIVDRDRLYVGTGDMGIIEIKGKTFEYVRESKNYDLRSRFIYLSKYDSNRMYATHQQGITSFYFNESSNKFELESTLGKIIPAAFGGLFETKDGALWVQTSDQIGKVYLLKPNYENVKLDLATTEIITYDETHGLPKSVIGLGQFDGELQFYSPQTEEIFAFNSAENRFENKKLFYEHLIDWDNSSSNNITDKNGKIWFNAGTGVVIAEKNKNGEYTINTETFKELKNQIIWNIYSEEPNPDGSQVVWLSGPDGVIRYDGKLEKPSTPNFNVKIRSLAIAGDSLLYAGGIDFPEKLEIPFDDNTVALTYAAPLFIGQKDMLYSTQLEGFDESWSDWTKIAAREYINLPSNKYTFKVKAKNVYGDISEESTASFEIMTPWFKTWWAYLFYVVALLVVVSIIVRARTKILLNQQKDLEQRVQDRTKEVNQRLNELATINHVSQALTEKLELSKLIKIVGNQMKKLFKSDITYLAILNPEDNIINFPYQEGDNMEPMTYGEGLTSKIIQTGKPLLINKDADIMAEYDKFGISQTGKRAVSYLGVPIPVENKIIGVISVQSTKQESRFNEEDKNLLNTIAINVGVALHNAELFEEAKDAKAKAEDANEAKSAFLSTVSHELRTPLTSVLGFAKIIRKRLENKIFPAVSIDDQKIKKSMKQVSENLNVVVSEGERLTTLINDVLDLAKIESGKMEWNKKPIFLQDVINRAIASTSSLFEEKRLSLKKKIPEDLPLIHADEDKLIQVVINLLSNAVKFTDKGKVVIEASLDNDQIMVEIQDTGIGIEEEDKHKVFERFRQAGDTLTDKPKGTGLGLPICREIIEHHGGIIWMKSEPGVGSTFFFSIPAVGESITQPPIQLDRILKSLKKQIKHSSLNTIETIPTILVVDDDTPIRSLLRQELTDAGYNVREAANGKAALDMVRMAKPNLIILDVMMPEINGFDVAAVLKNDPATMDIPIIILSIVQDKERGLRIGVDRYLTKPINTEQLFHEVEELLEQGVSKKKVLVVDEDISAVKTLSDVLSARGYKVMETSADNLMEKATESMPDIIMLNSVNGDQKMIKDLKSQKGMENVMFFIYE